MPPAETRAEMRVALSLCAVALLPAAASSFILAPPTPRRTSKLAPSSRPTPRAQAPDSEDVDPSVQAPDSEDVDPSVQAPDSEPRLLSPLEDAWQRFVLLRPGMTYDELKASTSYVTPGTYRTIIITSVLVLLAAVPYIVQVTLTLNLIPILTLTRHPSPVP